MLELLDKFNKPINEESILGMLQGSVGRFPINTELLELLGVTETKALYVALTNPIYWNKTMSIENKKLIEQEFNISLHNNKGGNIYRNTTYIKNI